MTPAQLSPWGPLPLAAIPHLARLSPSAVLLYLAIVALSAARAFRSDVEITDSDLLPLTRLTDRSLRRAKRQLEDAGLLATWRANGFSTLYELQAVDNPVQRCSHPGQPRPGTPDNSVRGPRTPLSGAQEVLPLEPPEVVDRRGMDGATAQGAPVGATKCPDTH